MGSNINDLRHLHRLLACFHKVKGFVCLGKRVGLCRLMTPGLSKVMPKHSTDSGSPHQLLKSF